MAKDKERSVNPAQQQRKAEKAKALKKSKADLQARRNEKLAKRNPERIQRQIDDLKALEAGGDIKPREKAILADLERDLKAVHKAKEALGLPAQPIRSQALQAPQSTLGKRRHDGQRKFDGRRQQSGSDTDESVRTIPWPRDTPPPVPKEFRRNRHNETVHPAPVQPAQVKTTYESAPQIRDLKREAVSRFVPTVVKRKQDAVKGHAGQLLEPEELDRLEKEGYIKTAQAQDAPVEPKFSSYNPKAPDDLERLRAEEEAFEKELALGGADKGDSHKEVTEGEDKKEIPGPASRLLPSRHVEMEEVEDEDL
ncbi:hypothetical protein LTR70_008889 [Exophiala xenobiotica]|uniref:Wbp11/ELF5/Saf1 N-terminal domain-containing protein n=1 Tax=Lithohypha guttulata TaxID=1690604 RepID=A0ABR0JZX9_9EURO|nr:hypothetical protein LTR24_008594 [Lithohypha guttulata]KAK5311296.1 hypothetical protein LTR70_008889 [Exophiala xenobiotica]